MRACSTASGGVIFIPDELEKKAAKISYSDLIKGQKLKKTIGAWFGQRKIGKKQLQKAA